MTVPRPAAATAMAGPPQRREIEGGAILIEEGKMEKL